ncbi:DUF551 domain-containing protein [Cronobacter malonaticus]
MSTISNERLKEKRAVALLLTEYKHEDVRLAAQENIQVIDELLALRKERERAEPIIKAAEKLVRCKGRYHSEQNYRALAALFGVSTPDLPPLETDTTSQQFESLAGKAVGGWIPCSEQMPEREYVLAADFSGAHYLPSLPNTQVGIYADWFEDGKPSWDDGDGNDLHLKQVTHWMPLPEPPCK